MHNVILVSFMKVKYRLKKEKHVRNNLSKWSVASCTQCQKTQVMHKFIIIHYLTDFYGFKDSATFSKNILLI